MWPRKSALNASISDVSTVIEEPVIVVIARAVIGPPHAGCDVAGKG
jgi:hypothetical protein